MANPGPDGPIAARAVPDAFQRRRAEDHPHSGLHSADDLIIYFPKSRVVAMGDLLLSQCLPASNDVAGYMAFLDDVIDVFPDGTTFISGHGKDLTYAGLRKYRDALMAMTDIVRKNYAAGKSAEFFDSKQTHIMCLTLDRDGNLLAGSVPNGLVFRITPQAKGFVLYQSSFPEIHDLALDAEGRRS